MKKTKLIMALTAAAVLASCGPTDEPTTESETRAAGETVRLEAIAFQPAELTIKAGTTVTWVNEDEGVAHTATSGTPKKEGIPGQTDDTPGKPDGVFEGSFEEAGDTYEFTFEKPGTYRYFCEIHAPMTGTVVVE